MPDPEKQASSVVTMIRPGLTADEENYCFFGISIPTDCPAIRQGTRPRH